MAYDTQGRLTTQEVTQGDMPLFASGFAYDRTGNMTRRQDSQWGDDRYRYDPVGRLVAHSEPDGALRQFVHDAAGNHLHTRVQAVDDSPGGWFREGVHEGVRYVFDRAGELRQRRNLHTGEAKEDFLWDENRQLIAVRKGEDQVRYGYDALGRRVFKQTPDETRWFYWQGDALAGETVTRTAASLAPLSLFDTGGRIKREQAQAALFHRMREYVYYPGTFRPLALLTQEGSLRESWHYHCDPNGAPVRLTSVCGEIVWAERTGAWGEKGQVFASRIDNPLRFQGQYFDPETGLHYNRYRYYDPAIAAYISQDPIGMLGGINTYQYAPNPLSWMDPLGLTKCAVNLDAGSVRGLIAEGSPIRHQIRNMIGNRQIVMTQTAADEALDAASRLAGPKEQERFLRFLDRVEIISDNPSQRALNLKTTRKVGDADKIIFGTADNMGIQTITSDAKFLKGASAQGVDFDALVHDPFSYLGL